MRLSNPAKAFVALHVVTGALDQTQVDVVNDLLAAASAWPIGWLAYGLATAWHEARLTPQAEWGKGHGKPYGVPGKYGQAQYGRGLVQLTWDAGYAHADAELKLNGALLRNFDLALRPDIAVAILVRGMAEGWFTGRKLSDFITDRGGPASFTQARRIINGEDRAGLIASYAITFQDALTAGGWA